MLDGGVAVPEHSEVVKNRAGHNEEVPNEVVVAEAVRREERETA